MMSQRTISQETTSQGKMSQGKLPLELYLHVPFCVQKCLYCDFLSGPADYSVQEAYMKALIQEVRGRCTEARQYTVSSIFIGGGTPSVIPPVWIGKLLDTVRACYAISPDIEISMEMNPGTVDEGKLAEYGKAGINRLSIGLQSASDEELRRLGRIHTYSQFLTTYNGARQAGFTNLNVDLMSALPGQTLESWEETLRKVLSLSPAPEHISAYSLIVEEGTPFYQMQEEGKLCLPDEEAERQMYDLTEKILNEKGYHRYEISNYSKPGKECFHNCGYWKRTPYLGFGIGAASLFEETRFHNDNDLRAYIADPLGQRIDLQHLTLQEQMEEFMFLGLRMTCGVSAREFYRTFQCSLSEIYGQVLDRQVQSGLMEEITVCKKSDVQGTIIGLRQSGVADTVYRLTKRGIDVSNVVLSQFLF